MFVTPPHKVSICGRHQLKLQLGDLHSDAQRFGASVSLLVFSRLCSTRFLKSLRSYTGPWDFGTRPLEIFLVQLKVFSDADLNKDYSDFRVEVNLYDS